jgi:hypothetical protein
MKTIQYSLIILLIFAFFAFAFTNNSGTEHTVLIQAADKNISSLSLIQTAEILSNRLKDFSSGKFDISVVKNKKQIKVILTDDWNIPAVENLLVQKGTIEFYETYNHDGLAELLNGDNKLFSLLTKSEIDNSGTKIGCTSDSETGKVTDYLNTLGLGRKCKFAWSRVFDKSGICLYALKLNGEKGSVINGDDVESAKYYQDRIQIKLKGNAVELWSDATRRNLDNVIAIVLDDSVISAPKVRSVIESGEIEISGNYSKDEAGYISALLNNGVLPAEFSIIK